MRAIRVASAALLGLGGLALCAPVILASDTSRTSDAGRDDGARFGFRVTPTTVAAGGRVSLHLDRGSGCRGTATVTSGLFDTVRIPSGQDSVTATVDRTAKSQSSYRVTFNCDGSSMSTQLAVASSTAAGHADEHSAADGRTDAQTGGRTDGGTGSGTGSTTDGRTAGHADGVSDSGTDTRTDGDSDSDSSADAGADGRTVGDGSGSGEELNPQPLPPGRGVQAGEGGSIDGFDLQEIGLGAALVVGSVGTAYRRSRRHAGEDGA
ncbi:hypothetical protein ACIRBZ_04250 [Streptomyces sp. NPDC094038]|uniref:hypothetical protein n=1 Tax=Streptomyces sp. NPDC094038 TaxID=3366055 RepID=UPI00381DB9E7